MAPPSACRLCNIYKGQREALETQIANDAQQSETMAQDVEDLRREIQIKSEEKDDFTQRLEIEVDRSFNLDQEVEDLKREVREIAEEKDEKAEKLDLETGRTKELEQQVVQLKADVQNLSENKERNAQKLAIEIQRSQDLKDCLKASQTESRALTRERDCYVEELNVRICQLEEQCTTKDGELQRFQQLRLPSLEKKDLLTKSTKLGSQSDRLNSLEAIRSLFPEASNSDPSDSMIPRPAKRQRSQAPSPPIALRATPRVFPFLTREAPEAKNLPRRRKTLGERVEYLGELDSD